MNPTFSNHLLQFPGGTAGLVIAAFVVLLALCWLLLPILLIRMLRELNSSVIEFRNEIRLNDRSLSAKLEQTNTTLAELLVAMRAFDENAHDASKRAATRLGNLDVHAEHTNDLLKWLGSILQTNTPPKP